MFCGAKYTYHTFSPIIKHLITTTANKHPTKREGGIVSCDLVPYLLNWCKTVVNVLLVLR